MKHKFIISMLAFPLLAMFNVSLADEPAKYNNVLFKSSINPLKLAVFQVGNPDSTFVVPVK